ncbi:acetate kinase [Clostridia bacterium]|nr:acetate kinase [Clostridia bacterium]
MNILVINAGSSSLKYQLIDMKTEGVVAKGLCERIGIAGSVLKHKGKGGEEVVVSAPMPDHGAAIQLVLDALTDKNHGVIKSMKEIGAVGHRVVHSAEDFDKSVLIDDKVLAVCEKNAELAPLHVPANITGIRACKKVMPDTPMVAVFDTAFHSTMPPKAYLYAVPYEAYTDLKVRRYGFHGTSHMFVAREAAAYLKKPIEKLKLVTCHLGNGSSITAVDGGKSVDTSMGFTPLEGVPMGTRSGDIDAAVIEYLMNKTGMTIAETINYLNKKSGVLGVSGVGSDFRDLAAAEKEGNRRAILALDLFAYRVKKYIGAYAAAMNGLDCVVFTAGVGENDAAMRQRIMDGTDFLGVDFDKEANKNFTRGVIFELSKKGSRVKVLIVPTNEELVIARETKNLV